MPTAKEHPRRQRGRSDTLLEVTLSTFQEVPWNMLFYTRLGFEVIPPEELGPALLAVLQEESRRGLAPALRVAMRVSV